MTKVRYNYVILLACGCLKDVSVSKPLFTNSASVVNGTIGECSNHGLQTVEDIELAKVNQ